MFFRLLLPVLFAAVHVNVLKLLMACLKQSEKKAAILEALYK